MEVITQATQDSFFNPPKAQLTKRKGQLLFQTILRCLLCDGERLWAADDKVYDTWTLQDLISSGLVLAESVDHRYRIYLSQLQLWKYLNELPNSDPFKIPALDWHRFVLFTFNRGGNEYETFHHRFEVMRSFRSAVIEDAVVSSSIQLSLCFV